MNKQFIFNVVIVLAVIGGFLFTNYRVSLRIENVENLLSTVANNQVEIAQKQIIVDQGQQKLIESITEALEGIVRVLE